MVIATDFSPEMVKTANENLKGYPEKRAKFLEMDNLKMTFPNGMFDLVSARHTIIDCYQIRECLKDGGVLIVRGVDKDDCWSLKLLFGRGQGYLDKKPISLVDYEAILEAGFKDVELVPIHEREYFKNKFLFFEFLKKVPIIDDFSEEFGDNKDYYSPDIDDQLLDKYIEENTYDGKIRLLRRYYGITARK